MSAMTPEARNILLTRTSNRPSGMQITFEHQGQTLLGDVIHAFLDDEADTRLRVHHFNGQPWPVDPLASQVEILERFLD
jgi:hypothetical protein